MTLLRHTPKEVTDRSALTINPAKTCQPIGAMYASLGINGCLPHSHGSQGCCSYHRSTLTRHYKEPVMSATSSFTEGASVFGGQSNLLAAIENMFTIYDPEIVAVHSTCLSETIGDDLAQIVDKARVDGKVPQGKHVVYAHTPSYVGSHVTGFSNMLHGIVKCLAKPTGEKSGKVNVLAGYVEPSDMEELKKLCGLMGVKYTLLPDTSGVLNGPMTGTYKMYPDGGTKVEDIKAMADAMGTVALGEWASAAAAKYLDTEYKVPCKILDLPIGVSATDRFIDALRLITGRHVPVEIEHERGQVVDVMADYHQYLHGKKVALAGDPDQLIPLVEMLVSVDMIPAHIVTGTPGKRFEERIREITKDVDYPVNVKCGPQADMFLLHQWVKGDKPDLLIGNTYMKYIARDEGIPLLRYGMPILDRVGHQYFPSVGYKGTLRLLTSIVNMMLDVQDATCAEYCFELQM